MAKGILTAKAEMRCGRRQTCSTAMMKNRGSHHNNDPKSFWGNQLRCAKFALCIAEICQGKEYTPAPWHHSSLGLSPDLEVKEQKKLWYIPIPWESQGKGVYTIGLERRAHTIEASDPVSTVVVFSFLLP